MPNDIETDCPVCEEEITIKARDIKLAVQHRKETGDNILVSCPACCRALRLEGDVPGNMTVDQWIAKMAEDPEDWCGCVPMLDATQEQIPAGKFADLGVTFYRPGSGGPALKKRPYMYNYGIDPSCHLSKNPSMGETPVDLGR